MSVPRLRARADRVNAECKLGELLSDYGYGVVQDTHREQQFACQLHGADNKPSARYYPLTNSTYCWVCQKHRDPIAYVMEHENVDFKDAIRLLEERLGLPALPWEDDQVRPRSPVDEINRIADRPVIFDEVHQQMQRFLMSSTEERELDTKTLLLFWEVFDRIEYGVTREKWSDEQGIEGLKLLKQRVLERLKGAL